MIETAGKILIREIRQAVEQLYTSVVPIYDVNEKEQPALLGSSVLLRIETDVFLSTAKHVIDANEHSSLHVSGPAKLEPLEGDFFAAPETDVAVMKLSTLQCDLLAKYKVLEEPQIADAAFVGQCTHASCVGYPGSKNKKIFSKRILRRKIYCFTGAHVASNAKYIVVPFRRRKNLDAITGAVVMAPDPHGMSGGAMFGVRLDDDVILGRPRPRFIGTLIEWDSSKNRLFATHSSIVLAIIRDAFKIELPRRLAVPWIKTHPAVYVAPKSPREPLRKC
jgi:hypothetical protein